MKKSKIISIAGVFAIFQCLMPLTGWYFVHKAAQYFESFQAFIPWIALILLLIIGCKMLKEGFEKKEKANEYKALTLPLLFAQGVATSIDALSVGFTIADYDLASALMSTILIGSVTFFICFSGVLIGKKFGTKLSGKASLLGGFILIFIGIEIFLTGVFGK